MPLSKAELDVLDRLHARWVEVGNHDELMARYYRGKQRVEQLGLSIPPALRRFLVVTNWPRVVVDTKLGRSQLRALVLPGEEQADPTLRGVLEASNFAAAFRMFNRDRMVYGRGVLSVSSSESGGAIIRAESPREVVAEVDLRTEQVTAAARFYGAHPVTQLGPTAAVLYLPDVTVWMGRETTGDRWSEIRRDEHRLGAVPVVLHLNRRESGSVHGHSEMADIIPLADSACRSLTDMQFSQAAHGAPKMWMTGVATGDFIDANGKPIPQFEAYWNAVTTLTSKDAKVGQLTPSDLKNFSTALDEYRKEASLLTGFPARYFGITTANPPAEGAIIADEINLVRSVEADNDELGVSLGWAGALAYRIQTGRQVDGNRVRAEFHNPATPTMAQREDALVKRRQVGALSRRGYWIELGWSEARIAQEEQWLADEAAEGDALLAGLARPLAVTADAAAGNG